MLLLTPIAEHHLPDVQTYASDPAIGAMSTVPTPYPKDGAVTWYGHVVERVATGRTAVFAMTETRALRGVISINDIHSEAGWAHLDYWVAVPHQGQGVASRAASLAMDYARTELKLKVMLSSCLTANTASGRVLERNGFAEYGRLIAAQGKFAGQELRRFRCSLLARVSGA